MPNISSMRCHTLYACLAAAAPSSTCASSICMRLLRPQRRYEPSLSPDQTRSCGAAQRLATRPVMGLSRTAREALVDGGGLQIGAVIAKVTERFRALVAARIERLDLALERPTHPRRLRRA